MLETILTAPGWEIFTGAEPEGVTVTPTGKALMGVTRTCSMNNNFSREQTKTAAVFI
jgi:hypothetical protein